MDVEYEWVAQAHPKSTPVQWILMGNGWPTAWHLAKGGRKHPGWFVWRGGLVHTRLNPNLTLDEAQDAAKLLAVMGVRA